MRRTAVSPSTEKKREPNSGLGKAITYLLRHWKGLTAFLREAGAPLDNNICKRALKRVVLHCKNALFYRTMHGAGVGDLFMTLIHTCQLCNANSFDYLTELQRHASELAADPEDASRNSKSIDVFGQRRRPAKMFRAGLYARLSTGDQQTLPMQNRALREYAARRGWAIAMQIREVGSGAIERNAREQLMEAARRREIDVVLVWRLDRWGRSVTDLLTTLQELAHLGVGFVSLTEALDLTTPAGRAMAGLLAIFAKFEREILRERTRAGLVHARQSGKRLGRPMTRQTEGD
jgi:hypothetical protein